MLRSGLRLGAPGSWSMSTASAMAVECGVRPWSANWRRSQAQCRMVSSGTAAWRDAARREHSRRARPYAELLGKVVGWTAPWQPKMAPEFFEWL